MNKETKSKVVQTSSSVAQMGAQYGTGLLVSAALYRYIPLAGLNPVQALCVRLAIFGIGSMASAPVAQSIKRIFDELDSLTDQLFFS